MLPFLPGIGVWSGRGRGAFLCLGFEGAKLGKVKWDTCDAVMPGRGLDFLLGTRESWGTVDQGLQCFQKMGLSSFPERALEDSP